MKKIFVITALLIFAASYASAASVQFSDADAGSSLGATAPVNVIIGKTSKGVKVQVTYDSGTTGGTAYALQTVHLSGSKIFGSAYDSTAIWTYSPEGIAKDVFTAAPLASSVTVTAFPSATWTTL
jgi:nitrous oxidase accessory protein NosD